MICECGNDHFYAVQEITRLETVVVDENGDYVRHGHHIEFHHPEEDDCIDAGRPCGPYICTKCGKVCEA